MTTYSTEWARIDLKVPSELADAIINVCHEHGSDGVETEDRSSDTSLLKIYFRTNVWEKFQTAFSSYLEHLEELFPEHDTLQYVVLPVQRENWATQWQSHFTPIEVGRSLLVTPPWLVPEKSDRRVIVIEPAEAFGTGTHETTQGCLELMEQVISRAPHSPDAMTLLDVGCGSAILAIAAVKLGILRVTAVDNDPVAVESARRNLTLNGTEAAIDLQCRSLEEIAGTWDIVTANLDPMRLTGNVQKLSSLPRYALIISGVPLEKRDDVESYFAAHGHHPERVLTKSEWMSAVFFNE
jgi:ribosomal protein L11 methyltransferase